ncbi:hypothetical protein NEUTE1DRAFT_98384 [Neurospora tetrasperma FGSC 2508]|uniref:Uncharacterized protein n=1 Tax=Neurospora tetrasperma (strain FGSC 2508 / ATCC MYA-4615 / P0657) TaxID=510951 RepID=F8MCA0_NEUT8|nr:uncharacterized protein NEUTE1DRAFT_98384 [Neurospora tetrasperma FGSC 2508]EGO61255.1 hypothetical protein NEUTE1DRAFT_98384 [Neurospora tetrasperma FGSC 2508]EGZ74738.1 hypothetical protein NEUTE2DRAFT_58117 [Neurospora tetrasperma FGSC 2509]
MRGSHSSCSGYLKRELRQEEQKEHPELLNARPTGLCRSRYIADGTNQKPTKPHWLHHQPPKAPRGALQVGRYCVVYVHTSMIQRMNLTNRAGQSSVKSQNRATASEFSHD